MKVTFVGFERVEFSPRTAPGFVYILCLLHNDTEIPFYVGQTQAIWGRLNDYYWAQFQASTDFRVGEAVRHLHDKGFRVVARYRPSEDPRYEETEIIARLRAEHRKLLNGSPGYDYRTALEDKERLNAQNAIDQLLEGIV